MKLTIFAVTGGIGRQLLEQAIAAGHDVTAVARNPQNLSPAPARAVAADLASTDPAALHPAVAGADAVLSALGPRIQGQRRRRRPGHEGRHRRPCRPPGSGASSW